MIVIQYETINKRLPQVKKVAKSEIYREAKMITENTLKIIQKQFVRLKLSKKFMWIAIDIELQRA